MIEVKTLVGALNLDDSQYRLPPNDYIDALNVTHDAVEGSNDQVITPVIANRIGDAAFVLPDGTNKCIGAYANTLRNTIIQMIWNSNDNHLVLEYNLTTRVQTKIFENLTDSGDIDILGFTEDNKITSINIYNRDEGDLLYFLDSLGRPTEMDIALFKQGEYTPVTRDIIDKAKKPPLSPPDVIYDNDTTRRSNSLRNKLFRFSYRWIYDDFEKSTFSPISIVALPFGILSDTYTNIVTNNNVINMVANTGDKNVKSVEIAMSFVEKTNNWSDFQSVTVLNKSELGLTQTTTITDLQTLFDYVVVTFSGVVNTGTVVNIYLNQLPNTETLVGTYTSVDGDTPTDVVNGLLASFTTIGIIPTYSGNEGSLLFLYYNVTYGFGRVEIINSNPDNDNIEFPYSFSNDSTYPTIDIEESIELFDYVPRYANAQELPNGNVLAYIGITEGYNKDTVANDTITVDVVAAGDGGSDGVLYGVQTLVIPGSAGIQTIYTLNGIPVPGTVVEVKVKRSSDHTIIVASTYTTVAGDTTVSVVQKLIENQIPVSGLTVGYYVDRWKLSVYVNYTQYEPITGNTYVQLIITSPGVSSGTSSIATWKWSTERNIARAYFDENGVTNGILYTNKVTFPAYAENVNSQPLVPFINYLINDVPPIWAYSMQFYMTKEGTQYIFWESFRVNKSESEYIYFDVSSFTTNAIRKPTTATVLSYTFQDGDRVRIIRDSNVPGTVFDDTYDAYIEGLVVDPIISLIPQTGTFLKIKNVEPFTSGVSEALNYVLEIYRPVQQASNVANQVYYEFGQQYAIIDPTLSTRRHSGLVTDQVVGVTPAEYNFYQGDAYFRIRTIAVGDAGYQTFNVMDRNFVDFYISAVSSVDGRPNIIDLNAREAYYSTLIRHSEAYQANTNINGLNRFYAKNFDEYDYNFGDALRMVVKNRQLIVCQKYKIGNVPLFSSIGKDPNGLTVVFNTDKLLNPIQYYVGDFGIGTCPESIASFNYAIYGCDNIKGIIWRLSNDGLISLSEKYKMNSWATDNLVLRTGKHKIYGAFDQRLNDYIIAADAIVCTGVAVPDFTINDALANEAFNQTVLLTGTLDFTLTNIVKPVWMTIAISGYYIVFSGTPTNSNIANDIPVSFDVSNDCGLVNIDTTMDVVAPPCIAAAIAGSPDLPNGAIGTPYTYSFDVTGTEPINISAVTKPAWMTIAVSGSSIVFSGTPDTTGTGITISFTIGNCSEDSVVFADTINVTGQNWFITYSNNDSSVNLSVKVGNNNTTPVNTLYSGLYTTDPLSGTDIVNLPAVNLNAVLNVPDKQILYASCNGVIGSGIGTSTILWLGITGGPLQIFFTTGDNYTLSAAYGMGIESVTGAGVPTLSATVNHTNSGTHSAMSGSYSVQLSGIPYTTIKVDISVNGTVVDCAPISGAGTYILNCTALASDIVLIGVNIGTC